MSVSKSIVELHGGCVSVHSDGIGAGSAFVMDIPIVESPSSLQLPGVKVSVDRTITKETLAYPSNDCLMEMGIECDGDEDDEDSEGNSACNVIRRASSVRRRDTRDLIGMHRNISIVRLANKPFTSPLSVLVVDDVSLNRRMLHRLIVSSFRHIAHASDGLEAVQYVLNSNQKPDIILMDFVMPIMDGPTATKELRAFGYKGIIIGVTGNALPRDVELFLNAGATCVLTKPFRLEELYAAIASS